MRIWFQLMASEERSPGFIAAVQRQLDAAVSPGTEIKVFGTRHGAYADQYRILFYYDEKEIIENGVRAQREGYDVFALGNSLDPGVVALREILDIPVLSMMEVACSFACMTGERFGVVATNDKYLARYNEIVVDYRFEDRLAGIDSIRFDALPYIHEAFNDESIARDVVVAYEEAGRRLVARGADVLIATGVHTTIAADAGLTMVDGAIVQHTYALVARVAEAVAGMHELTGVWTSRGSLYGKPPPEVLRKAGEFHGNPVLANWPDER